MTQRALLTFALPVLLSQSPALAQTGPNDDEDIVVVGQRERGSAAGDVKPEIQLRSADIRALGVSNIAELISELAPQLESTRGGSPVVLLEGRRISSFREIATLPSEAIARVDILPEEVALKYGYPDGQKVANIVLRQRFRAKTVELGDKQPTDGGGNDGTAEFDYLRIKKGMRFNLDVKTELAQRITEAQRGIDTGNGIGPLRTLSPAEQQFDVNATYTRNLSDKLTGTLNAEVTGDFTQDWLGPDTTGVAPIRRPAQTYTGHAGLTLDNEGSWRWTLTATYDHKRGYTHTDNGVSTVPNLSFSHSNQGESNFILTGSPFHLPAGDVTTTIKFGGSLSGFASTSQRNGVTTTANVTRDDANGQVSLDIPIASRKDGVLAAVGDLSLNGNAGFDYLSDFGLLRTLGAGVHWTPRDGIDLISSWSDTQSAPTPQQLGNPVTLTPNVPVFDFVSGRSASVNQLTGGTQGLLRSDARSLRVGLTVKPFSKPDVTFTADFNRTFTTNPIYGFPGVTAAAELAFSDRFTRDANGMLTEIDARPVNLARSESSQIRLGINFSKQLKTSQSRIDQMRAMFRQQYPNGFTGNGRARDVDGGGRIGDGRASGSRGDGGRGGGRFGGGGSSGGRLTFAIYDTIHLNDTVTLSHGMPPIDLLNGGAIGSSGGQPRHEIQLQAGISKNGLGARLTGSWNSPTTVVGATGSPSNILHFSSLATLNLRLFASLGQIPSLAKNHRWLRGVRVSLLVDNLFNARQHVTDGTGVTPTSYQPGFLDPEGRTIKLSIRKQFF